MLSPAQLPAHSNAVRPAELLRSSTCLCRGAERIPVLGTAAVSARDDWHGGQLVAAEGAKRIFGDPELLE